jgi:two-component system, OmpR family, response regulator
MSRILVVDDEPRIVNFLSRTLSAQGYVVAGAPTGPAALQMLDAARYDLVVLDLVLPGMDGISVLRETMDRWPGQRVMVMSAISDVRAKVECLDVGASDYVTKPFALAELIARVRLRLRQVAASPAQTESGNILDVGELRLDLARRTVEWQGVTTSLTTREFLLLRHMMENAGQVCDRQRLLSEVWGFDFDPGSNVVDVYVRRLRKKIGDGPIETVRNVGYILPNAA